MKSNEENKTWISNILVRNNFLCLKQVYCCLTFVFVYIWKRTRSDSVLRRKPLYQQKIKQPIDNTNTPPTLTSRSLNIENIQRHYTGKMGTNCAPLLADIFLYSFEAEFIQSLLWSGGKQLASRFNFTYRYIYDVLSINNPVWELHGPDVPRWTRDQRHDREQHSRSKTRQRATLLLLNRIYFCRTWRFQFPYHKFSVPE